MFLIALNQLITLSVSVSISINTPILFDIISNVNRQNMDRIRKKVTKVFKEVGLKIEIKTNFKVVDLICFF